jgi:hypothetical protein
VAYILYQMRSKTETAHIDTPEKLFEYFLMDVQMDPCMQTSRIRHALSSVQLFIERCLMNLEPTVAPSSINAKQWEWMKRYRVWEANRKVFIWPENWLEPELRDDQSPFFKETMSELLQSDITEDSAASALLNYLSKLEEVAKLEPCGIYYVENEPGTSDDIVHVVARTAGASRKYFYRRREYGYWRPWEQIRLDIEDNPVIPVVWKGRLLLFWLRVLKQAPLNLQTMTTSNNTSHLAETSLAEIQADAKAIAQDNTKVTVQPVLCWSEYYNGKWQPAKTSDVNRPADLGQHDSAGFDRSALRLLVSEADNTLRVNISGQGSAAFTLYNTHSLPIPDTLIILPVGPQRSMGTFSGDFTIVYSEGFLVFNPNGGSLGQPLTRPVLKNELEGRAIQPNHTLQDTWDAPFFYEDSRHVFMVSTSERIVMVREFGGFGYEVSPLQQKFNIPPLVQRPVVVMPDKIGPITTGRDAGVVDPAPIERFVSEDAYINKGLGTTGTVRYGDKEFGPAGALLNGQMRQE